MNIKNKTFQLIYLFSFIFTLSACNTGVNGDQSVILDNNLVSPPIIDGGDGGVVDGGDTDGEDITDGGDPDVDNGGETEEWDKICELSDLSGVYRGVISSGYNREDYLLSIEDDDINLYYIKPILNPGDHYKFNITIENNGIYFNGFELDGCAYTDKAYYWSAESSSFVEKPRLFTYDVLVPNEEIKLVLHNNTEMMTLKSDRYSLLKIEDLLFEKSPEGYKSWLFNGTSNFLFTNNDGCNMIGSIISTEAGYYNAEGFLTKEGKNCKKEAGNYKLKLYTVIKDGESDYSVLIHGVSELNENAEPFIEITEN